jgi:hypothetical protein
LFIIASIAAAMLVVAVARCGLLTQSAGFDRFAIVAALDVLAMKVMDWHVAAAAACLAVAAALVLVYAIKELPQRPWPRPGGVALLLVVAIESLAGVTARLSSAWGWGLALTSLAFWIAGLTVYALLIVVVGPALDPRRDPRLVTPDWWIAMGALSIITVSGAWVFRRVDSAVAPIVLFSTWAASSAWLPLLVIAELRRSRLAQPFWRYQPAGWSTVFPLGMYALAAWWVGELNHVAVLEQLSEVGLGFALAAWLLTLTGAVSGFSKPPPRQWRGANGDR